MTNELGPIHTDRKSGNERFHAGGESLDFNLLSFWQWVASDLVGNTTRGLLAEYIVARALGLGKTDVREEWAPVDLQTPEGIRIEVKSSAYVQAWQQARLSTIQFGIRKTRAWDPGTGLYSGEARRQADVYVFALLAHKEQNTIDPLNVDQWRFYVLPTAVLDAQTRSQDSITLPTLERLSGGSVSFQELPAAFQRVVEALTGANTASTEPVGQA